MNIFLLMEFLIVIISIATVYLEIRKMIKLGFHQLTFFAVLVSLYWTIFYIYQLVRVEFNLTLPDHRAFVRSGILFSMVVFLSKAINVNRRIK